jgi:Ni/Fe-hydrogenase subunit HybB-like protein
MKAAMRARERRGLAGGAVVLLLAVLVLGVAAYARQLAVGDVATGMRTLGAGGAVWGLYVVMDGFFLGAGVAIMGSACVARFSRDRELEAVARIAMPTALVCFLCAALVVLADQGRPLSALANLALYARPQSPMFTTFATVGAVGLFASLVHCVLARRPDLAEYAKQASFWQPLQRLLAAGYRGSPGQRQRRQRAGFWMSLLMLPALAMPLFALAVLFTVRPGRPTSVVVAETVAFTLASAAVGLGLLVIAAALVGALAAPRSGLASRGFARLGRALLMVDALTVLAVVMAEIVGLAAREPAATACARALLGAAYGPMFWGEVGLFLLASLLLWQAAIRRRLRPGVVVIASVLSIVAVYGQRHLALVPWQTHGLPLPYPPGSYVPTWLEIEVVAGIVALALLLLIPSVKLIPFAPRAYDEKVVPAPGRDVRRTLVTLAWFGLGLGVAGAGLALSARAGTEAYLDPAIFGSPVVFVLGLLIVATTGAVYELWPERG